MYGSLYKMINYTKVYGDNEILLLFVRVVDRIPMRLLFMIRASIYFTFTHTFIVCEKYIRLQFYYQRIIIFLEMKIFFFFYNY